MRFFLTLVLVAWVSFWATAQELVSSSLLASYSQAELIADYGPFIQNGVEVYKLTYTTTGVYGQLDTASGILVLPDTDIDIERSRLAYQHGTVDGPEDVPSNLAGGSQLAIVWGGVGLITTAADYLGMGESTGFHPYVHAATEASAAIDLLYAGEQYLTANGVAYDDRLFVSGYSQGGHAAAALHKELEANHTDNFTVVASAPMSGPYDISGTMLDLMVSDAVYFTPAYLPNTLLGMNEVYDLGFAIGDVFKASYVPFIEAYYNGDVGLFTLNTQLIQQLFVNAGACEPRQLLRDSIVNEVLSDEAHPLVMALADNDVYDWTPQAPTRLFYCTADDQVPYTNSIVASEAMNANGATNLEAIDVDSGQDHTGCVDPAVTASILFFGPYINMVSTSEQAVSSFKMLSPNPTRDFIELSELSSDAIIGVYNEAGYTYLEQKVNSNNFVIDVSGFDGGIYFVIVNDKGRVGVKKVVVE